MTLRPPKPAAFDFNKTLPISTLDYELAQEKASALGRLGRGLEQALAALVAFDAQPDDQRDPRQRGVLVAKAGSALWHFIVQREASGLRDSGTVMRDYRVPAEVRDRMGFFPVR